MHSMRELPASYELVRKINLQKDKKDFFWVNFICLVIFAVMIAIVLQFVSLDVLFPEGASKQIVFWVVFVLYMVLHELTHAAAMKYFGGHKMRFGFTGLYAYAGSEEDYFDKKAYIVIALAPFVVWTIIFTVVCFLVPRDWFGVTYFLQVGNVSGCGGDLYVSFLMRKYPSDTWVKDTGLEMFVYQSKNV